MTLFEEAFRAQVKFTMETFKQYVLEHGGMWNNHMAKDFIQKKINDKKAMFSGVTDNGVEIIRVASDTTHIPEVVEFLLGEEVVSVVPMNLLNSPLTPVQRKKQNREARIQSYKLKKIIAEMKGLEFSELQEELEDVE